MTPYPPSILAAFLQHVATEPQRPCLIWQDEVIGYGQLATAAAAWAYHYAKLGVVRGDRVGLYLNNTPSFLAAYLGSHMLGAAAVLINTQYRQIELRHILSDSAPHVAVSDSESAPELQAALNHLHSSGIEIVQTSANSTTFGIDLSPANPCNMQLPYAGDLAILAYTSGTTGRSKGAMLTHGNLVANSTAVIRAWHWTKHDRLLIALPLFHIHGLGVGVHGTLLSGASMELHPHFEPHTILSSIATGTISMFFGVPTTYSRLLQAARGQEVGSNAHAAPPTSWLLPPTMRLFVSGSAALSPQIFYDFQRIFGHTILERYGMTETVMNLTNPYQGERRPGSVGVPFPGQEVRIVDVRSRQALPDGEVGEIQVRGPHVCVGYWRNPEATAEVFGADGWFSTGDLGQRSSDGYISITGRARELIISGGYNIYPREVEERLMSHPAVAECAVRGLPDPDFGEQVVAWVVPTPEARPTSPADENTLSTELIAFCREGLAAYKRPRQIFYLATLPRNALGKVQKHLLD